MARAELIHLMTDLNLDEAFCWLMQLPREGAGKINVHVKHIEIIRRCHNNEDLKIKTPHKT